jgi:phosphohistidine phosphatase
MTKTNDNQYQLFVLRHGKAADGELGRDFDRILTDTGIVQAEKIANWLDEQNIKPDVVLTSPAKRTLMTAKIVINTLNIESQKIRVVDQIYQANLSALLKVIASCPIQHKTLLLVGHNPALEDLVEYLLSPSLMTELQSTDRIYPATLVHLEMKLDWSQLTVNCAQSVAMTHGKFLS